MLLILFYRYARPSTSEVPPGNSWRPHRSAEQFCGWLESKLAAIHTGRGERRQMPVKCVRQSLIVVCHLSKGGIKQKSPN